MPVCSKGKPGDSVNKRLSTTFLFLLLIYPAAVAGEENNGILKAMTEHLACYPVELLDFKRQKPLIATKDICLSTIYHEKGGRPFWVTSSGPSKRAGVILDHLLNSFGDGLDPEDYETTTLQNLWDSREPKDLARLDTLLTYNLVKYIHDLSYGQLKFHSSDPKLFAEAGNVTFNPVASVETALAADDIGRYLDELPPQHHYYQSLRQALSHYRELSKQTGWTTVPAGPLIRPGTSDDRLAAIQLRLTMLGEIEPSLEIPQSYHAGLVDSIIAFQKKRGLKPDGIIGTNTIAALNKPIKDLITVIQINLARWRWHAHDLGRNYIMVNIANFTLKAVRNDQVQLDMPVIVGKLQHQTPVFSDTIRYLDVNPFWNVPSSIAMNEELPELRKNPQHLVERHIRLFSSWSADAVEIDSTSVDWQTVSRSQMARYKLRQDPGRWNALGSVKFVFPNHYSVYLHDTPAQDLFSQTSRSFSHGCIRVSKPLDLALFSLEGNGADWSLEKIMQIAALGDRKILRISPPLPVHVTYQTVWVDNERNIYFNSDIYGRDAKLIKVLVN